MVGASFINTLLSVLCVFLVPFTFLAAKHHVLWFFRWLLWVVSVSSSFHKLIQVVILALSRSSGFPSSSC